MNKRFRTGAALGALAVLHFIAFLVLYIPNYVIPTDSVAATYVITFVDRLFEFVLPLIAATMLFVTCTEPKGQLVLRTALISVASFVYNLPYYYLIYIAQGNDSLEALLISLGMSAIKYLVFALLSILFYFTMRIGTVRAARRDSIKELPPAYREHRTRDMIKQIDRDNIEALPMHIAKSRTVDLTSPVTFGIFCACFVQFALHLVTELVSIVSYLIEYLGDYRESEILYIIIVLMFIFAALFISHFACYLVKYLITRGERSDDDDEALGE